MIQGYTITEQITMATLQCGGLKRKYQFSDEDVIYSSSSPSSHSEWDSEEDSAQSDTVYFGPIGPFPSRLHMPISSILKKTRYTQSKGSVHFGLVTVFFFQRCQGCCSVPSHGGCTLGMVKRHAACQQFTLREHAEEQQHLQLKRLRERHQEERLEALRQRMISSGTLTMAEAANLTLKDVPDEDVDLSSAKLKDGGLLRPYSSKRRHALLKAAGVVRIDREEKRQLQELRRWREDCGCHCQGFCYPETCDCSQAGIKCQMDRTNFPCGCSKEVCGNPAGRIEFNSSRVQSHYIHTHMKLELEKRLLEAASEQQSAEENRAITFTIKNNSPAFQLSSDLCRKAEKSSSSDMTDTSCSSALSQDFDMDGSPHELGLSTKDNTQSESNTSTSQLKYLDENANQAALEFVNDSFDIPNTPSPSADNTADCYMDLSLSSDSDLVFFDSFHEYTHFKGKSHMDYMSHIQFPSCPSPAQIEDSGVGLLESLIGIS